MEIKYVGVPEGTLIHDSFIDEKRILSIISKGRDELYQRRRTAVDGVIVSLSELYEKGAIYNLFVNINAGADKYETYTAARLVVGPEDVTLVIEAVEGRGNLNDGIGESDELGFKRITNPGVVDSLKAGLGRKVDINALNSEKATGIASLLPNEKKHNKEIDLASSCIAQADAILDEALSSLTLDEVKHK